MWGLASTKFLGHAGWLETWAIFLCYLQSKAEILLQETSVFALKDLTEWMHLMQIMKDILLKVN